MRNNLTPIITCTINDKQAHVQFFWKYVLTMFFFINEISLFSIDAFTK